MYLCLCGVWFACGVFRLCELCGIGVCELCLIWFVVCLMRVACVLFVLFVCELCVACVVWVCVVYI